MSGKCSPNLFASDDEEEIESTAQNAHKMLVEASNLHPITTNTQFNTKSTQKLSLFGEAQRGESEDFSR